MGFENVRIVIYEIGYILLVLIMMDTVVDL